MSNKLSDNAKELAKSFSIAKESFKNINALTEADRNFTNKERERKVKSEEAVINMDRQFMELHSRMDETDKAVIQTEKHFDELLALITANEAKQEQSDKFNRRVSVTAIVFALITIIVIVVLQVALSVI